VHSRVVIVCYFVYRQKRCPYRFDRPDPTDRRRPSRAVYFRAPLGSSLRGRDVQDVRVRNVDILVRIDRSGPSSLSAPWSLDAFSAGGRLSRSGVPSRSGQSLGLATSLPSLVRTHGGL
jgi:hypothetical protein